ncbi:MULTISPECIES: ZIP family metal transporter [Salimicrobium]|uniref:ZIP family metal transporter n=1 Tax=Salimicrobium humidisoli TaxID=2029857 RepID=A0ABX4HTP5_9BACI|nr:MULTISPECIES: ZIP family metal transporter [Salimicrobium]PBB06189.1 ZIP family metal transporter [Salimicrobium humidisoli]
MFEQLGNINPVILALLGSLFTWGMTALGAALVFLIKGSSQKFLDSMLAFAGGVMIAASYWSLLAPAIERGAEGPLPSWFPAVVGFLLGGFLLLFIDRVIPMVDLDRYMYDIKNKRAKSRTALLMFSMTLHNIPEGLAVGVAFGAVASDGSGAALGGAIALAIGIGIQNFPEGAAVSMPLYREGMKKKKSFMFGQFSGMVEPISAVIGAAAVIIIEPVLPYALSFAAGAMIFVVAKEIIPGSHEQGNVNIASMSLMFGFALMMTLDVALG